MDAQQAHGIQIGDRVNVKYYGPGTVMEVHRVARGTDIYFVGMDAKDQASHGWHKAPAENLTPNPEG